MFKQVINSINGLRIRNDLDCNIIVYNFLEAIFVRGNISRIQDGSVEWRSRHSIYVSESAFKRNVASSMTILERYLVVLAQKVRRFQYSKPA